jgi:hypothetical protein
MFLLLAVLAATPLTISAQGACPDGAALTRERTTQDACQKAIDLFQYMAPQVGTVIAGGNATLGQGGTLGGFALIPFPHPKVSVGVRFNALYGSLPNLDNVSIDGINGRQSSTIETKDQVLAAPAVDVAIGVFKGLPLGVTNFGGVDLLVSAIYLPEFDQSNVTLNFPDGGLKIGYGARLGIIQESLITPGVSVTFLRRDLPTANLSGTTGTTGGNATLTVNDLEVNTTSWRAVASKSLVMFGLALGAGQDEYKSGATISGSVAGQASDATRIEQNLKRTNYFADVSMNLFLLKIIGEVGMVQGGTVETFNTWDGKQPDDKRFYGSVGMRLSF